jgi:arylsulfatase A-like enzyme
LIVFLSDNGGTINTYANNQPLAGYKYMFGEGGIRIPILFSMPGTLPEGKPIGQMVSAMDVFPTLLELLGEAIPSNLDGSSLLRTIRGDTAPIHDMLFWSNGMEFKNIKNPSEKEATNWVVRRGPWKLIQSGGWTHTNFELEDGIAQPADTYHYPQGTLLFNLEDDIGETKNLASRNPEVVEELSKAYKQWKSQMLPPRRGEERMSTSFNMLK